MKRSRYLRILFFFWRVFAAIILWELILARIGFRRLATRTRERRLQRIARAFHDMAVDMGGVLIKVGQFLSARADMLPEVITQELSGLQDEVPAENFAGIRKLAETELGGQLSDIFASFEEEPLAAASLGQVHRARLHPKQGEETGFGADVVVKIQRPDIETIINTDLAALNRVGRWVMVYKPIRLRADVPALLKEFSTILYEEIDYLAEGANADTFAKNFKDIPGVRIPGVAWTHTTRRVLTLEDVFAIKITDYEEITAAGIDRKEVSQRLFDIYLRQIFEDGFFHADPHPGNLFVEPREDGWLLTFVDFGMVGHIPPNSRAGLREFAIGLGTQDPERMIKAYQLLNALLPSADIELIKEAEAKVFDRFWGKSMDELREIPLEEMHEFAKEFRELVFDMPFQVPHDLIFLVRMIAILAGICTGLDPTFNPWESLAPYATKLLSEENGPGQNRFDFILKEVGNYAQILLAIPRRMDSVLSKIERDRLRVNDPQLTTQARRIEAGVRRLVYAVIFLALLSNGVQLDLGGQQIFANVLYGGAALALAGAIFTRPRRH